MVDGLHIPIRNRTKKSLAIALSVAGMELRRIDNGDPNWNFHYESPTY
jgi:hypothetical protein